MLTSYFLSLNGLTLLVLSLLLAQVLYIYIFIQNTRINLNLHTLLATLDFSDDLNIAWPTDSVKVD